MTGSSNALRRINRRQVAIIRVQWFIILALIVALVASLLAPRPAAAVEHDPDPEIVSPDELRAVESEPVIIPAPTPTPEPEPKLKALGEFKLTAYCPCKKCCGKAEDDPWYGITAYGYTATAGRTIAVDPKVIPIGTEVIINGHTYVAEDVGGAIKENRIDIFFDSHEEALTFGVQYATVYVSTNKL